MTIIHRPRIWEPMQAYDVDQRKWLQDILDRTGLTVTEVARRAGLDPSTLTRFMNVERDGHMLSARTVRKIEQSVGSTAPAVTGFQEEATPYIADAAPVSAIRSAVLAIKGGRNGIDPWIINGSDLEGINLFRGDILMVDLGAEPVSGDVVCVQMYDWGERPSEDGVSPLRAALFTDRRHRPGKKAGCRRRAQCCHQGRRNRATFKSRNAPPYVRLR